MLRSRSANARRRMSLLSWYLRRKRMRLRAEAEWAKREVLLLRII